MKLLLRLVLYGLIMSFGAISALLYDHSLHHGLKPLECVAIEKGGEDPKTGLIKVSVAVRVKKLNGFVSILTYDGKATPSVHIRRLDERLDAGHDYPIRDVVIPRGGIVLLMVTQTPVCGDLETPITEDMLHESKGLPADLDFLPISAYFALHRLGHHWVYIKALSSDTVQ